MKNLWPLVFIAAALFAWNKFQHQPVQDASRTDTHAAASWSGGAVRDLENEPTHMMEREAALPSSGGLSSQAMLDGVRHGLQGSNQK
ncbi:MAG: hypothetical protein ACHQ4J_05965 [Candidatus Binatia bacterium]